MGLDWWGREEKKSAIRLGGAKGGSRAGWDYGYRVDMTESGMRLGGKVPCLAECFVSFLSSSCLVYFGWKITGASQGSWGRGAAASDQTNGHPSLTKMAAPIQDLGLFCIISWNICWLFYARYLLKKVGVFEQSVPDRPYANGRNSIKPNGCIERADDLLPLAWACAWPHPFCPKRVWAWRWLGTCLVAFSTDYAASVVVEKNGREAPVDGQAKQFGAEHWVEQSAESLSRLKYLHSPERAMPPNSSFIRLYSHCIDPLPNFFLQFCSYLFICYPVCLLYLPFSVPSA